MDTSGDVIASKLDLHTFTYTPSQVSSILIRCSIHTALWPIRAKRLVNYNCLSWKYLLYSRAKYLAMAMVSGIFIPPSISKTGTHMQGISEKNWKEKK